VSQKNVELVKRALDAFNRRDLGVYDELYTPDFAGFPSMTGIAESTGYTRHEGFETFLAGLRDTWDEFHLLAEEFRAIGDRVLVLCRIAGRARTTGVQVEAQGRWCSSSEPEGSHGLVTISIAARRYGRLGARSSDDGAPGPRALA
jgi:ketosteroid isomerase-like protein